MPQDSQLQQDVLAEFKWEPSVTPGHIGVTANRGVVTLSGHVGSYAQKHAAETAARRVKGVEGVAEEIEVRLPFDTKRNGPPPGLERVGAEGQRHRKGRERLGYANRAGRLVVPERSSRARHPSASGCRRRIEPDDHQSAGRYRHSQR